MIFHFSLFYECLQKLFQSAITNNFGIHSWRAVMTNYSPFTSIANTMVAIETFAGPLICDGSSIPCQIEAIIENLRMAHGSTY